MHRFTLLMGSLSALALCAVTPASAENVYFSGALTGQYGHINPSFAFAPNVNAWSMGASGALEIGDSGFNVQLDGSYDRLDTPFVDADVWSIGGSAFWSGDMGRAGINVNYALLNILGTSIDGVNFGAFADYYADDMFTANFHGGGFAGDAEGYFIGGGLTAYLFPEFALSGLIDYTKVNHLMNTTDFTAMGEFLLSQDFPASVFAGYKYSSLSSGLGSTNTFFVGLKFYFGNPGSTLVEHHRLGVVSPLGLNSEILL